MLRTQMHTSAARVILNCTNKPLTLKCQRRLSSEVEGGSGDAAFYLGIVYELGLFGLTANDTKARKFYEIGTASNHPECMASLAFFLRHGFGGPPNIPRATLLTEESAKLDSIHSIFHKQFATRYGINMPNSCDSAILDLRKVDDAILENLPFGRRAHNGGVGRIYPGRFPTFTEEHEEKEKKYRKLDELYVSNNYAKGYLGMRHHSPNYTKIIKYFVKAANKGHASSMAYLGVMYVNGYGVTLNQELGYKYLRKAMEVGNTMAATQIAIGLLHSTEDPKESRELAQKLLSDAAGQGYGEAFYQLARQHQRGQSPFPLNLTKVKSLFSQAFTLEHLPTIFQTGVLYLEEGNCDDAYHDFMLFAELSPVFDNAKIAMSAVGSQDYQYALRLYQRLADMGSEAAAWNAKVLCEFLGINSSDWMSILLSMKFHTALGDAANLAFESGDREKAIEMWSKAAVKDARANYMLGWEFAFSNLSKSISHFEATFQLKPSAVIAVYLSEAFVWMIHMPKIVLGLFIAGEEWSFLWDFIFHHFKMFTLLSLMIFLRFFIHFRMRDTLIDDFKE